MKKAILFSILMVATNAWAECECKCIRGESVPVCDSELDIPLGCLDLCPPSADLELPTTVIPQHGTNHCWEQEEWNDRTRRYETHTYCQ